MKKLSKLLLSALILLIAAGAVYLITTKRAMPAFTAAKVTNISQPINLAGPDVGVSSGRLLPEEIFLPPALPVKSGRQSSRVLEHSSGWGVDFDRSSSDSTVLPLLVNKEHALPAEYVPPDLIIADVAFTFKEFHEKKLLRREAATALKGLFTAAREANVHLYAISGYRSYSLQKRIFDSNVAQYGFLQANQFSAKPGESEHQTGLAMDVSCAAVGGRLTTGFARTAEGQWLLDHAAEYGFIIRYPKGKEQITGYQYEPWHLRYVGEKVATAIAARGITLEEYIGDL